MQSNNSQLQSNHSQLMRISSWIYSSLLYGFELFHHRGHRDSQSLSLFMRQNILFMRQNILSFRAERRICSPYTGMSIDMSEYWHERVDSSLRSEWQILSSSKINTLWNSAHSVKLYALCVLCGENIHYLQGYKLNSTTDSYY